MAKHSLLHRADCHASGVAEQFAAALKDGHEPVFLCAHHTDRYTESLASKGWVIVVLNEKAPVPA